MAVIALVGDATTTTAVALAAAWPESSPLEVVVVETDASGGSLAAWLDTPLSPSLSTLVTALHAAASAGTTATWETVDSMIRRSATGVRFVPAPFRTREARRAAHEAERTLFPLLAAASDTIAIADAGRIDASHLPGVCRHATLTLVCHRQDPSSAPAATVRLERLAESVEALSDHGHAVALVLLGEDPFALDEVTDFVAPGATGWTLAVDPLAAAVLAGRNGVSARRLGRLPLLRSAARIAHDLDRRTTASAASVSAGVSRER